MTGIKKKFQTVFTGFLSGYHNDLPVCADCHHGGAFL